MEKDEAQKFIDAFKKTYPGIDVDALLITADEQKVRGVAEGRAGQVSFDVVDASDQIYTDFKKVPGLITDNSDLLELAGIKKDFIFDGTWNPEWTVYGAAYNPNLVKESELPTDWNGFLDPKWKGKLAVENRLITFIYATPFWGGEQKVIEYLQKLKANEPRFNRGDIATNKLLVAGEFPILLGSYLQNYWRYVPDKAPWALVPFKEIYTNARALATPRPRSRRTRTPPSSSSTGWRPKVARCTPSATPATRCPVTRGGRRSCSRR